MKPKCHAITCRQPTSVQVEMSALRLDGTEFEETAALCTYHAALIAFFGDTLPANDMYLILRAMLNLESASLMVSHLAPPHLVKGFFKKFNPKGTR